MQLIRRLLHLPSCAWPPTRQAIAEEGAESLSESLHVAILHRDASDVHASGLPAQATGHPKAASRLFCGLLNC